MKTNERWSELLGSARMRGTQWVFLAIELARKLGDELPNREHSPLQATLKTIGAIDTVRTTLWPHTGDPVERYATQQGLVKQKGSPFVNMFFGTDLHKCFAVGSVRITDYTTITDARGELGRFVFTKNDYADAHDPTFYAKPDADMHKVLEGLWRQYEGRLYVSVESDPWGKSIIEFSSFPHVESPFYGGADAEMKRLVDRHRRCRAQGSPRSYMLFGPPGTGKSTFATAFAEELGSRTLKLSAESLEHTSIKDMIYLLENLCPEFLIVDDIDKVNVGNSLSTLLETLQRFKSVETTIMMTANTISGFDKGLLRPDRIDTWVEFKLPELGERREVLRAYLKRSHLEITDEQLEALAVASDTLSQDYLRELVVELRQCGSFDEVMTLVEIMKRLLASVEEKKGSDSPAPETKKA